MTDIIANAKKLLDGATPGEWVAIPHDDWDNAKVIAPDDEPGVCEIATMFQEEHDLADAKLMAASKSHAQALAEESYEYIVQVKRANAWQFYIGESRMVSDNPGAAYGFSQRSNALEFSKMETKRPTRIVRRRVSPVEEIE